MTINPTLGHLYHDFSISNAYTALDAQELFKTRQRNAREKRQLDEFTRTLNKAQDINLRRLELEELSVRNQLEDIRLRSPSLRSGLRQQSVRRTKSFCVINDVSDGLLSSASHSKCASSIPSRISSSPNSRTSHASTGSADFPLYRSKSQMYVRKVNNVTKSLTKLYDKQQRRKIEREVLLQNVRKDNEELLEKSRVYFKDSDITHDLENILGGSCKPDEERLNQTTVVSADKPGISPPLILPTITHEGSTPTDKHRNNPTQDNLSTEVQPSRSDEFDLSEFKVSSRNTKTIPELWQLYGNKQLGKEEVPREPLLVTITARYRRTLVD